MAKTASTICKTLQCLSLLLPVALLSLISANPQSANAQQRSPEHQQYCLKLEGMLAKTYQTETAPEDNPAKIRQNIRNVERIFVRLNNEAERRDCYSYFLFSKELRRSPRCVRIDQKIREAKSQLESLNRSLHSRSQATEYKRDQRSDLIRDLARNKCGYQYEKEANKRSSLNNWFGDAFFGGNSRVQSQDQSDNFRFSTHKTLCVRLCDGYFFPVSFATTQNRFSTDEATCQSSCAAPAKLFTYPNPGGDPQNMSGVNGEPYNKIKNAWRFKKEFVRGCSCKPAEYDPVLLEAKPATPENAKTPDVTETSLTQEALDKIAPLNEDVSDQPDNKDPDNKQVENKQPAPKQQTVKAPAKQ